MKLPEAKSIALFLLAIVFSIALMFAFIELPVWIDALLTKHVGFPGFDHGMGENEAFKTSIYIDALHLRWIGYGSLILIVIFIIMGFTTKKTGWAWAGAFTLFLPVFGQFALSMFFLSGLGILRAGWFPFMDISWSVLDLGKVIYIPYWILMWFFSLFNWYAHDFASWFFMAIGALLFGWGVVNWFQTRFGKGYVATSWIYKLSRHPQYLGWIIWSYGLMLFSSDINNMKKTWAVPSSLPWLLMTMVIIAICLIEELKMKEQSEGAYEQYQKKTPFLFPFPKWLKRILKAPMRLVIKNDQPKNVKQVFGITVLYTAIFISISMIWVVPDMISSSSELTTEENSENQIDIIVSTINQNQSRRTLGKQFESLGLFGNFATENLIQFLDDNNPDKREFAAQQLGNIKSEESVPFLISKIDDPNYRVCNETIRALGKIGAEEAIPALKTALNDPDKVQLQGYILDALANLGVDDIWPIYVQRLNGLNWYERTAALNALNKIDQENSYPYVYEALKDEHPRVRSNAVIILLKQKPVKAIEPLKSVIYDDDYETKFYARQAIKLIEKEDQKSIKTTP